MSPGKSMRHFLHWSHYISVSTDLSYVIHKWKMMSLYFVRCIFYKIISQLTQNSFSTLSFISQNSCRHLSKSQWEIFFHWPISYLFWVNRDALHSLKSCCQSWIQIFTALKSRQVWDHKSHHNSWQESLTWAPKGMVTWSPQGTGLQAGKRQVTKKKNRQRASQQIQAK